MISQRVCRLGRFVELDVSKNSKTISSQWILLSGTRWIAYLISILVDSAKGSCLVLKDEIFIIHVHAINLTSSTEKLKLLITLKNSGI